MWYWIAPNCVCVSRNLATFESILVAMSPWNVSYILPAPVCLHVSAEWKTSHSGLAECMVCFHWQGHRDSLFILISEKFCLWKALKTSVSQLFTVGDELHDHTSFAKVRKCFGYFTRQISVCASPTGVWAGFTMKNTMSNTCTNQKLAIFESVCDKSCLLFTSVETTCTLSWWSRFDWWNLNK